MMRRLTNPPVVIALFLSVVVLVNLAFMAVAIRGADTVDPTYAAAAR